MKIIWNFPRHCSDFFEKSPDKTKKKLCGFEKSPNNTEKSFVATLNNNNDHDNNNWRTLWQTEGTGETGMGDRNAAWLEEIRSAIHSRVAESAEEDWDLDGTDVAKVLTKKKNWSAPGPDRQANF